MEYTKEQLKLLIGSVAGYAVIYQAAGDSFRPIFYTKNVPAFSGLTEAEYLAFYGADASAVVPAQDMPALAAKLKRLLAGEGDQEATYRTYHKTRGFVWTHVFLKLLGVCEGAPVLMGSFTDVSAAKAAPDLLLDNSSQRIYVVERDSYDLLYANSVEHADKNSAPVLGQTCYQYIHKKDAPCENCVLRQLRANAPLETVRYDASREKTFSTKAVPMNFFGKRACAFFIDDLTKHIDLEKQLRQEQEKYRAATEGANLRVYEYNIRSHTIVLSEHARRLFGVATNVISDVPESVLPCFHKEDYERVRRFFARVDSGKKQVTDEFLMNPVDGCAAYLRYTFTTVSDDAGAPLKAYAVAEDITALKREEAGFNETLESLLTANPDALCSFRTNLTQNECSEGHGASRYIQSMLRSDTVDQLFENILSIIPNPVQREKAAGFFSRKTLTAAFAGGKSSMQLDYQRAGESGRLVWVRSFVNMLKKPDTQDIIAVFYSLDVTKEKRQNEIFNIITKQEYDYVALLHTAENKIEFLSLNPNLLQKYHTAFGQPGTMYGFDETRHFAAQNWIDAADRDAYLKESSVEAVRRGLEQNEHYELSVRGHYTGHPDETMCRKIQHYYLDTGREIVLIIQTDVTETYLQQERETALAKTEKAQLADILNKLSTGICVLKMPDPEHVYTTFCNQQIYKLLDMTPNASIPEDLDQNGDPLLLGYFKDEFSGIHKDDQERMRKAFRDGFDKTGFTVSNVRYLGGKGEYKYITIDLVLRESKPDGRVFYASYRDVSQENALRRELELQQQKQMENTLVDTIGRLPACSVLYQETDNGPSVAERYSDEFCKLKECTQEEVRRISGADAFEPVHPDDRAALKKAVIDSQHDERMHNAVYRIVTKRSGYKWVSVNYTHFSIAGQRFLYVVYTDIDALKKQEQQLEEQYNSAQAFLDSIAGSYLATRRVNLTKNLVEAVDGTNPLPQVAALADYDSSLRSLISSLPVEREKRECAAFFSREALIRAFESGTRNLSKEYRYLTPDGSLKWARSTLTLTKRPTSGDIVLFLAVSDISQEKLINTIMDRVVITQFDNISCINARTNQIEFFHAGENGLDGMDVHSGDDYEAVIGEFCRQSVVPSDQESFLTFMRMKNVLSVLDSGKRCINSFTMQENGALRAKQVEFFFVDRENALVALLRTDYTEAQRRQLEQEERLRLALAAAKKANEAKSDFLSRMSHDIRTPLNGIIGMSYLAKEQDNPARTADCLKKIDTSSKFLLSLINDILDLTKAENDKIELHPEPYVPRDFYEYLDAVFQPQCGAKGQKLIVLANPPQDVYPVFDKLRINQILFNLLSNAVKYTPEGGTITYWDQFSPPDQNGRLSVVFQISDTGIGMSDDFQQHLFEPFTQEGRAGISASGGSGLGLAIAKELIDLMGGEVSFRSEPGKGTSFTVRLTADSVPAPAAQAARPLNGEAQALADLVGIHVLLCEDQPLNQEIAKALLAEKKMLVTVAENGRAGLDLFRLSPPHYYQLILMDIRMPVMNGYETAKAIRMLERPDAGEVPILAMTADAFADDVQKCLDAGMNGHVAKPIEPERLFAALQKALLST